MLDTSHYTRLKAAQARRIVTNKRFHRSISPQHVESEPYMIELFWQLRLRKFFITSSNKRAAKFSGRVIIPGRIFCQY